MRIPDCNPKISLPLVLPRWLSGVYVLITCIAITTIWLAAIPAVLAAVMTGGIVLCGLLNIVSSYRQYGGYLHYDGVNWYRQRKFQELLAPKSAYMPWPSMVVLNFKGGLFTGPRIYIFTCHTLGRDALRQLRVLLNTHHF